MSLTNLRSAFTLVELLVVVAIIVVLIAILLPAMERSIYLAQLASCGSNIKNAGTGALAYATDNKAFYPNRPVVRGNDKADYLGTVGSSVDDRPMIKPYIPLKLLSDPLTERVDHDNSKAGTYVFSDTHLWFGFQYAGFDPMLRMSDRFTYSNNDGQFAFDLLVADRDMVSQPNNWTHGTHGGIGTSNHHLQDKPETSGGVNYTFSRWQIPTRFDRGPVDMNFGRVDGSVTRYDQVLYDDERFTYADEFGSNNTGWKVQLPMR